MSKRIDFLSKQIHSKIDLLMTTDDTAKYLRYKTEIENGVNVVRISGFIARKTAEMYRHEIVNHICSLIETPCNVLVVATMINNNVEIVAEKEQYVIMLQGFNIFSGQDFKFETTFEFDAVLSNDQPALKIIAQRMLSITSNVTENEN
jgi:hypothetical protein